MRRARGRSERGAGEGRANERSDGRGREGRAKGLSRPVVLLSFFFTRMVSCRVASHRVSTRPVAPVGPLCLASSFFRSLIVFFLSFCSLSLCYICLVDDLLSHLDFLIRAAKVLSVLYVFL